MTATVILAAARWRTLKLTRKAIGLLSLVGLRLWGFYIFSITYQKFSLGAVRGENLII